MKKIKFNGAFPEGEIREMEGYFFKIGEFDLVAHKRFDVKGWAVSELSTGWALYKHSYKSRKTSIEAAGVLLSKDTAASCLAACILNTPAINEITGGDLS